MNEKPEWMIFDKVLSSGHGGYPDPKGSGQARIPLIKMPTWWNAPINSGEGALIKSECLHENTRIVHLFISTVTECKDCGQKIEL